MIRDILLKHGLQIINFGLAIFVLVLVHEFGHFIAAVKQGVRVEIFSLGFGRKLFIRKKKDTEYAISAIPLGGYVKLAGDNLQDYKGLPDEFLSKPVGKRFNIIFFGPVMNYLLAILLFCSVFFLGYPYLGTKVGSLREGLGAMQAGIEVGDRIISVEGKKVKLWDDMASTLRANSQKESVTLVVSRDDKEITFQVSLMQYTVEDALKQKRKIGAIGISPDYNEVIRQRYGFFESIKLGFSKTFELTSLTYRAFGSIIARKLPLRESAAGPVAILDLFGNVKTLTDFLLLTAILSLSLAIFNLLPLPALDGFHIVLLGIEKIRGRYLSQKAEEVFGQIGMGFLILLAVLVTYNDLARKGAFNKFEKLFNNTASDAVKYDLNRTNGKTQD
jgi:regulator of sigma E protease